MKTTYSLTAVLSMTATVGAIAAAAMLTACSSVKLDSDVPVEARTPGSKNASAAGGAGAGAGGAGQSKVTPIDLTKDANDANSAAGRVVYFDFDSYTVKDEYRPLIDRYSKTLAIDRKKHLQVEGHTDERGGREYNLALGQKRAESVAKSLALLGAGDSQIEAVSYGKERPAAQGSDESAWAKNRRAELTYR